MMAAMRFASLATLLLGTAAASATADPPSPPAARVMVRKDVVYFEGPAGEEQRHRLDLYLPEVKKPFPMLLFIHGGAWRSGSKDLYFFMGQALARQGIGVAVANYRLSPAVKHPEHVRDVARAFGWLEAHVKELGGDPSRLYVMGHSAGGHLVALLALDPTYLKSQGLSPTRIRGVIGISGPYLLAPPLFPEVFGEAGEARSAAFPLNHVGKHPGETIPPFLILYGEQDYAGLPAAAKALQAALQRNGGKSSLAEIADRDHISIIARVGQADDPTTKRIVEFIGP
jgi:acetyl esterase/lipase